MVFLVTGNVILRLTPVGPISGTFELTGYLGALLIVFALAHNQATQGNISVDFLVSRLSHRTQAMIDSLVYFISTVLYGVIAWRCVEEAVSLSKTEEVSPTLSLPFFPIVFTIGLGCGLLGLVLLTDFLKSVERALKK
jgi:TRAP-type C4-dicarboxylate transport system permease small subunit